MIRDWKLKMCEFLLRGFLILLLIIFPVRIYCQNLVRNCDFDRIISCPDNHSQLNKAFYWYVPTNGTSDLCHTCAGEIVGIPSNMWGNQEPYSGTGFGHIISYYSFASPQYREYMQAKLACALIAGEEYDVSFFVSNSDNSGYGIDGMGLHFSQDSLLQDNNIPIDLDGLPEITNPAGVPITDKTGWVEITGTYTAQGGERFITIGNFLGDDEITIVDYPGSSSNYASYYVSHVSVVPTESWLDLGNDTITCTGETITVDAGLGCDAAYLWNDGNTNAVRVLDSPGWYSVSAGFGCGNATDEILFEWFEPPDTPLPQDTFVCPGGSVYLDGGEGFSSYQWHDGSMESHYLANGPGLCWLEVTDGNGCRQRDSTRVSLLPEPDVNFGEDMELCHGDSALLDAGNEGISASYLWQDMSTGQHYTVVSPGEYLVVVTNPCGSSSDSVSIAFKSCETLVWLPNTFSPNSDGINDRFQARGVNLLSFKMYIYSRWGELIFESRDIEEGWDGRISGKPCPADMYVWMVVYESMEDAGHSAHVQKGNVLLLR